MFHVRLCPGWLVGEGKAYTSLSYLAFPQGPGEINRRKVSWTLTERLDFHLRIQARSRGGRWCWNPALKSVSPELTDPEQGGSAGRLRKVGLPSFAAFGHCSSTAVLRTSSLSVTLLCTAVKRATVLYTSCYGGNVEAGDTA